MRIFFKEYHVRICKGWTGFAKENGLKAGDRMIFKLVSKDTFLIKVVSKASKREINTTTSSLGMKRKANGKTKVEFRKEKKPTLQQKEGKKPVKIIQNSTDCRQFEKILSPTSVKRNDITLPKKFFIKNGLVEKQTLFLKSTIDGIPWETHFSSREYDVRLCKGWLGFAKENGLKVGDRLSFKLVSKDTFLINVVSKTSEIESRPKIRQKVVDKLQVSKTSKSDSRSKIRQKRKVGKKQIPFKKSTAEGEISKIVRDYNLRWMYMYFAKSFCVKNKLTLRRDMILKDLKGKEWLVKFSYNGQHGRFSGGWNNFCTENRLKEGDKCIFKLINEGTMLVHIIKSESE
ncbi:hypothetical protein LUZ60_008870 [Juncus effusus]|nr:hypothetical protein LUZ60_008870 [Juncus effusus]